MLLIITHTEDYTVDYVVNILNKRRLPFFRLNTDLFQKTAFEINIANSFEAKLNGNSNFSSLWFRRIKLPQIEANFEVKNYVALDFEALLFNLISIFEFKNSISDPYIINKAENKLYQLKIAQELGFNIPNTFLTNSQESLISFISSHPSIIKPLRKGNIVKNGLNYLIYTNRINSSMINQQFLLTPAIFQNEIKKEYEIRVTVVNNKVFSAKVQSQHDPATALDWRRKSLKFEPFELPKSIEEKCIELVKQLGLRFGAIDLIYSTENLFYFLEINPNGQWVWIELDTGLRISDELINTFYNG